MNNKPMSRMLRLQQGITLVELVSTLGIASIVLSIAVPGMNSLTANNQITSAINNLVSNLHLARSEAIKQGNNIVLCPSSNGTDCDDSFEWHQGLMVFTDKDKDKIRDDDEEVLRVQIPFSKRIIIKTSSGRKKLRYIPTGTSPGSNTTFKFCPQSDHTDPRKVTLSNTGRPRVSRSSGDETIDCS